MELVTAIRIYTSAYLANATQMATADYAARWMWTLPGANLTGATYRELVAHATTSAKWANLGYTPGEAAPLISQGVTPETAAEMEEIADEIAGSPDERAAQRIDALVADGTLVDPARVSRREDPDDPTHIIVSIRPE